MDGGAPPASEDATMGVGTPGVGWQGVGVGTPGVGWSSAGVFWPGTTTIDTLRNAGSVIGIDNVPGPGDTKLTTNDNQQSTINIKNGRAPRGKTARGKDGRVGLEVYYCDWNEDCAWDEECIETETAIFHDMSYGECIWIHDECHYFDDCKYARGKNAQGKTARGKDARGKTARGKDARVGIEISYCDWNEDCAWDEECIETATAIWMDMSYGECIWIYDECHYFDECMWL